jgi:beta-glucosidase
MVCLLCFGSAAEIQKPPYLNPALPIDVRVDDLVGRMTLEEKISQTLNNAPAIDRLGIPAYEWWNEALHGVARAGVATVFPQAIGLAAMWDESQMLRVASVISDEARAKHHEFVRHGRRGRYQGLTFWSPNINIFRDPRWGRGMETYGEDPFLTGILGIAFIKGMQGDDPKYLKVVTSMFRGSQRSEAERHVFDAQTTLRPLGTYLPFPRNGQGIRLFVYGHTIDSGESASAHVSSQDTSRQMGIQGHLFPIAARFGTSMPTTKLAAAEEAAALAIRRGCVWCGTNIASPAQSSRDS